MEGKIDYRNEYVEESSRTVFPTLVNFDRPADFD